MPIHAMLEQVMLR